MTTDEIMTLAEAYGRALLNHGFYDAEYAALRTAVEALVAERDELRQILADSVKALGSGAGCAPTCSMDFLRCIPDEIGGTVTALRGQP